VPYYTTVHQSSSRCARAFCEIAQPVHVPSIKEIEEQFKTEFDYRVEAQNLERVRQNLLRARLPCRVPRSYAQHCTKHVLVMEELHGEKLVDVLRKDLDKWVEITGKSVKQLEDLSDASAISAAVAALESQRKIHEVLVDGLFNADCHPGASRYVIHRMLLCMQIDSRIDTLGNILLGRKEDGSPELCLIDYGKYCLEMPDYF
jgi:predicted unusual protein kinase regulating ubiquinone biosynthesis (AarF/ABC1/UbiB family)